MSLKTEEIARTFADWLERYSPPMNMRDKPDVQTAETEALLRVLLKFSPAEGYNGWLVRVLDKLEYQMKTRAWPTKGEIGAVCSNINKEEGVRRQASPEARDRGADTYEINAGRIQRGEAIGDEWIYGTHAVEIVSRGLVSEGDLTRYRSALFFQMRDTWGEDKAKIVESDLHRRHEDAKRYARSKAAQRNVGPVPDKRNAPDYEVFA